MYPFVLAIHNILRWVVLLIGIWAVIQALLGWFGNRDWTKQDRRAGLFFTIGLDIQLLLGLLLYVFLSPWTKGVFQDFGAAMSDPTRRFFALEHAFYMLLAVICGHLGSALPKRVAEPKGKHQRAVLFFFLALLVILLGMPWMRPLLRGF